MSFSGSERDEKLVPNKSDDLSDKSLRTIYCREQGCANRINAVFCGDVNLLNDNQTIRPCRGPPELNQICQQDSRAYVTTTENSCDFEGVNPYFLTSECTDLDPCNWSDVTAWPPLLYNNNGTAIGAGGNLDPSNWSDVTAWPPLLYNNNGTDIGAGGSTLSPGEPSPGNNHAVYWAIGVCGILAVLLICFFIFPCLKKICKKNNWISGRKRNETNGIPMRQRKQVGNGNSGTISEPEDDLEDEFIPPAPSSGP